jgi:hypothetical protein
VNYIRQKVALFQEFATATSFIFSLWRKANVNPTGKEILGIPFGFTVAQKDEIHVVILMQMNTIELN